MPPTRETGLSDQKVILANLTSHNTHKRPSLIKLENKKSVILANLASHNIHKRPSLIKLENKERSIANAQGGNNTEHRGFVKAISGKMTLYNIPRNGHT